MLLFVDETENESFFIVGGVLIDSRESAIAAYRRFKKRIKDFPITENKRKKLYTEFKSVLMDNHYQKIKLRMIEEINEMDSCVIYSCYIKKDAPFVQSLKEQVYIELLSKIVVSINSDVSIIFDKFNLQAFDNRIVETISDFRNVQAIMPRDSQTEPGLQFADNVCSILRKKKTTNISDECYKLLEKKIREV